MINNFFLFFFGIPFSLSLYIYDIWYTYVICVNHSLYNDMIMLLNMYVHSYDSNGDSDRDCTSLFNLFWDYNIHIYIHIYTYICISRSLFTSIYIYIYTYPPTYIHTYMHAYIHTYIYIIILKCMEYETFKDMSSWIRIFWIVHILSTPGWQYMYLWNIHTSIYNPLYIYTYIHIHTHISLEKRIPISIKLHLWHIQP